MFISSNSSGDEQANHALQANGLCAVRPGIAGIRERTVRSTRGARPLIKYGKGWIWPEAFVAASLPNRHTPHGEVPIERLEPCEGKLSRTVLKGAWAGDRSGLPGS